MYEPGRLCLAGIEAWRKGFQALEAACAQFNQRQPVEESAEPRGRRATSTAEMLGTRA